MEAGRPCSASNMFMTSLKLIEFFLLFASCFLNFPRLNNNVFEVQHYPRVWFKWTASSSVFLQIPLNKFIESQPQWWHLFYQEAMGCKRKYHLLRYSCGVNSCLLLPHDREGSAPFNFTKLNAWWTFIGVDFNAIA